MAHNAAQANLARILATTTLQWGLSVEPPYRSAAAKALRCSVSRLRDRGRDAAARTPSPFARAAAQTALGLTWGWCY